MTEANEPTQLQEVLSKFIDFQERITDQLTAQQALLGALIRTHPDKALLLKEYRFVSQNGITPTPSLAAAFKAMEDPLKNLANQDNRAE